MKIYALDLDKLIIEDMTMITYTKQWLAFAWSKMFGYIFMSSILYTSKPLNYTVALYGFDIPYIPPPTHTHTYTQIIIVTKNIKFTHSPDTHDIDNIPFFHYLQVYLHTSH